MCTYGVRADLDPGPQCLLTYFCSLMPEMRHLERRAWSVDGRPAGNATTLGLVLKGACLVHV